MKKSMLIIASLVFLSGCSEESMNAFTKSVESLTGIANTVEDYKTKKAQREYIERQQ